ncbi:MAG: DnaA N-terminal domain-containing protein, partial [bacterium]
MNTKELWEKSLAEIELSMSRANFTTWFKNTSVIKEEGGTIYLGVPNEFVKDWLYNKFHKLILKTLINHEDGVRSVEYVIHKYEAPSKPSDSKEVAAPVIHANKELPLNHLYA